MPRVDRGKRRVGFGVGVGTWEGGESRSLFSDSDMEGVGGVCLVF